jgi:fatty-acid desaturase
MTLEISSSNTEKDIQGSSSSVPEAQEKVRGRLAMGLLILFATVLLISVFYALFGTITNEKSDLIKYLISGLVGMMGVVIGFYYGQNSK